MLLGVKTEVDPLPWIPCYYDWRALFELLFGHRDAEQAAVRVTDTVLLVVRKVCCRQSVTKSAR